MEFSLASELAGSFPVVVARGKISEDDLIALGKYIRKSSEAAEIEGVLIDCQHIEGALSAESLLRATPAFTMEVGQTIKVAYINPPSHWIPADDQFSRDVAYNRGGLLELFESADDAVSWLQQT